MGDTMLRRLTETRLITLWSTIVFLGCSGTGAFQEPPPPPPVTVASVTVVPQNDTLWFIDDALRLTATAMDAGGSVVGGHTVAWSSDNTDIVTVASDGLATARAVGTAHITAMVDNVSQSATILVQRWKSLSAARNACAVTSNGVAYCWSTADATPEPLPGGLRFDTVAVGTGHACGLTPAHAAYCWGNNEWGALGDGSLTSSTQPVAVSGGLLFATITTMIPVGLSGSHTCGLTADGAAYCWGRASEGQLGGGRSITGVVSCGTGQLAGVCRATPNVVAGGHQFRSISAGSRQTCGVSDTGTLYCWGQAVGIVDGTMKYFEPVAMPTSVTFTIVQNKFEHTCGLTSIGEAYCWGADLFGKLGYGTAPQPVLIHQVVGADWISVDPASQHTCGVKKDHKAYCWGRNQGNSLADGTDVDQFAPAPVVGDKQFVMVSAGTISCGIATNGAIYCWGLGAPVTRLADP